MGKKIFKMNTKAVKELKWYDDTRENQFIVYSPYFIYAFIDKQDAIESGVNMNGLEFREIRKCINGFSENVIYSGDILKGFKKNNIEISAKDPSPFKWNCDGHMANVYKGKDARHTVVVREDYLPKDVRYLTVNTAGYNNPVIVQDSVYDGRWAYVLPINTIDEIERNLKF